MQCRAKFLLTYLRNISNIRITMNDLRYIQELSGHSSSKTTETYTYVFKNAINKIRNPIDDFFE